MNTQVNSIPKIKSVCHGFVLFLPTSLILWQLADFVNWVAQVTQVATNAGTKTILMLGGEGSNDNFSIQISSQKNTASLPSAAKNLASPSPLLL